MISLTRQYESWNISDFQHTKYTPCYRNWKNNYGTLTKKYNKIVLIIRYELEHIRLNFSYISCEPLL